MTYQRLVPLVRQHPGKLIITGEDRFLGYSLIAGADAALIGMAASVPALAASLFQAHDAGDHARFIALTRTADAFAAETFRQPMEGYIRRMLWAAAAEGRIPADACDDPWGPELGVEERNRVVQAVRDAQSALG
jgi:4-hydroxy-tetrahydrodipicolinate synthase